MFSRQVVPHLLADLAHMSAVVLLGPRQVGETTLALGVPMPFTQPAVAAPRSTCC